MTRALTLPEVDAAIARLDAVRSTMAETLLELDDHPGRTLLEAAPLEGATYGRWAAARVRMADLWADFDAHGTAVGELRSVRARRSRPSAPDLVELTRLLTAPVFARSSASSASERRGLTGGVPGDLVTLDDLEKEMSAAFAEVTEVLEAVDKVWNELRPQIERGRTSLHVMEGLASDLGLDPGTDPVAGSMTGCARRLEAFGALVQRDPLSLWADGKVDPRELHPLTQEIEGVRADLGALDRLRASAGSRVEAVASVLAEVRDLIGEVERALEQARRTVSRANVPAVPRIPATFTDRLCSAKDLQRRGRWRRLSEALDELERDAAAELARVREVHAVVRRPLEQRAELRGRLDAYRAKTFQLGRGEETAIEEQWRVAHQLLWRSPCDLDIAAAAVAAYQRAVNAPPGSDQPRGANADPVDNQAEART